MMSPAVVMRYLPVPGGRRGAGRSASPGALSFSPCRPRTAPGERLPRYPLAPPPSVSAVPRRMTGVVGPHQHVGGAGRVGLLLVACEGGEGPVLGLGGTAAQGTRGEEDVDTQVEGEPVPQKKGSVQQQHTAGREFD